MPWDTGIYGAFTIILDSLGFMGTCGLIEINSIIQIQALWSAARYNVDAKFIVCNTCSYTLLQVNIHAYWKERQIIEIMIMSSG
jgi:hypothetical protein